MKILLLSQRFRPLVGGAETVLWELAREWLRQDHAVTVLTARWDLDWPDEERIDEVRIVRVAMPRRRFWGTWRFIAAVKRWVREHGAGFDVCYVSMLKHAAWAAIGAARRQGMPVVLRPEGGGPTGDIAWQARALGGTLIRRRCRRAAAFVALSAGIAEELIRAGYPIDRIHSIPNGVPVPDLEEPAARRRWRERLDLDPNGPVAVFVGRLSPEKGLTDLIAAWRRVAAELPAARLIIIGGGSQQDELRQAAADLPGIRFVGETPQPQRYLRAADLFVLPSHEEGMSIALLEAMSFALPIVASDIPGNRALVESGRHGLLVATHRPAQLAHAIVTQLQAKGIAAAMGRAARQRVFDEFSIEQMAALHVELLQKLVRKKGGD